MHKQICEEIHGLYRDKNIDYGGSFVNTRREVERAIIVRLMDKLERLKTLTKQEARVTEEKLEDTLIDLANYCIMEVIEMRLDLQQHGLNEEISSIEIIVNQLQEDTEISRSEIINAMVKHISQQKHGAIPRGI